MNPYYVNSKKRAKYVNRLFPMTFTVTILIAIINCFFGAPRSDTCQTCDRLENLLKSEQNQDVKQKILHEKEIHLWKSEEFYKDLKSRQIEAKANDEVEVISFDFQQNMPLPVIPSGDVFYKRQL